MVHGSPFLPLRKVLNYFNYQKVKVFDYNFGGLMFITWCTVPSACVESNYIFSGWMSLPLANCVLYQQCISL